MVVGISSIDGSGVCGFSGSSRGVAIGVKTSCRDTSGDDGGDRSTKHEKPHTCNCFDMYVFNFKTAR